MQNKTEKWGNAVYPDPVRVLTVSANHATQAHVVANVLRSHSGVTRLTLWLCLSPCHACEAALQVTSNGSTPVLPLAQDCSRQ